MSLEVPSFNVSVSCKGKAPEGGPKVTVCAENEETYSLEGCAPLECATMPLQNQTGYKLYLDRGKRWGWD